VCVSNSIVGEISLFLAIPVSLVVFVLKKALGDRGCLCCCNREQVERNQTRREKFVESKGRNSSKEKGDIHERKREIVDVYSDEHVSIRITKRRIKCSQSP
jgi:hypothetical protein